MSVTLWSTIQTDLLFTGNTPIESLANSYADSAIKGKLEFPLYSSSGITIESIINELKSNPAKVEAKGIVGNYNNKGALYIPALYNRTPIHLPYDPSLILQRDSLPLFWTDEVRNSRRYIDVEISVNDLWMNRDKLIELFTEVFREALTTKIFSSAKIRETIEKSKYPVKFFLPSWSRYILMHERDGAINSVLDIFTQFNENLAAILTINNDVIYDGYNAEPKIFNTSSDMIKRLGGNTDKQVVHGKKFISTDEQYEVVLLFLPIYNQIYKLAQSPDVDTYLFQFYIPLLKSAWNSLQNNGSLIMFIYDFATSQTAEFINLFIEKFLPGSSWRGIITVGPDNLPVWIWRKKEIIGTRTIWSQSKSRSINKLYPNKSVLLSQSLLEDNSRLFAVYNHEVDIITQYMKHKFPETNNIRSIIQSSLMFLLQERGKEKTLLYYEALFGQLTK